MSTSIKGHFLSPVGKMKEIAIDIGGTFTDVVLYDGERFISTKVSTTPGDLAEGILVGIHKVLQLGGVDTFDLDRIVHGTTIGTNAILERKGALVGILTTKGFEDVLEIGRLQRSSQYDVFIDAQTPVFLAPRRLRMGINERMDSEGNVLIPLDEDGVRKAVEHLKNTYGIQCLAVCYLFSFKNPAHELRTREIVLEVYPDIKVSLSSEVDPVFREYERTCVTAFDAYLRPIMETYLADLTKKLESSGISANLQIMQSRGSLSTASTVSEIPVRTILSGPAAGVIGSKYIGEKSEHKNLITLDMGGTSCDVALISEAKPLISKEGKIGEYPLRVPMVDVSTIGAGGGSIAWIDAAGGLRVGPISAGAKPGPVSYGLGGTEPTVTDASLILGYLNPQTFAGGEIKLDRKAAEEAVGRLAKKLGLRMVHAAYGIHKIVNSNMANQIRLVSMKRGYDPRQFSLMLLGGAGPLHGGALAAELNIPRMIVPQIPGVLSAFGLLVANIEYEHAKTFLGRMDRVQLKEMEQTFEELNGLGREKMIKDGVPVNQIEMLKWADMRYVGQSFELDVQLPEILEDGAIPRMIQSFHEKHQLVYGHSNPENVVEIINLRSVHVFRLPKPEIIMDLTGTTKDPEPKEVREAVFSMTQGFVPVPVYDREQLGLGQSLKGPVIIEQSDTTTVVYPGQDCWADGLGNIIIQNVHGTNGN
jgi:N-methylhydantoinase A